MYERIEQSISRFINLDKAEFTLFTSKLHLITLKRKEVLLMEGQVCSNIYFINSGCLRYYYNVNGEEKTAQFFFENGWYTNYDSFLTGKPTDQYMEALEKTELLAISKTDLESLYMELSKLERFGRKMAENAYLGVKHRTKLLANLTAEERYLSLIKERPKIFERIPQHYVASYLGIQPPSLSRIRKRLMDNPNS